MGRKIAERNSAVNKITQTLFPSQPASPIPIRLCAPPPQEAVRQNIKKAIKLKSYDHSAQTKNNENHKSFVLDSGLTTGIVLPQSGKKWKLVANKT
jgi:hypothetical protein